MDANPYSVDEDPQTAEWVKKYHHKACPAWDKKRGSKKCQCDLIESMKTSTRVSLIEAYDSGYEQAILDLSWTCGDCGNVYTPDIK